jgi:very-short-patch-repair endonuclease
MGEPFIGSEAVAAGALSHNDLRRRHVRVFPDVYVGRGIHLDHAARARAGWLWSGRQATVAGFTAAAMHGSKWVAQDRAVELIHRNRHRHEGLQVWGDRVAADEARLLDGLPVTTPARTALDLGCWYPLTSAVAAIDALARATELEAADAELLAQRYPGRRGIVRAREALDLMDAGAQSPKESWLRVLLVRAGLPRPRTQIPVEDENGDRFAYLDMGWDQPKVAAEYDGAHHRTDRAQFGYDIRRLEKLQRLGWTVVRVTAEDRPADIVRRVRDALARRT